VRGAAGSVGACAQLPFKYLGIELTGDNADPNAVMPRFTYEAAGGCTPSKSGSHLTLRWRELDSNPRSPVTVSSAHPGRARRDHAPS
jgi:hypothetical protein